MKKKTEAAPERLIISLPSEEVKKKIKIFCINNDISMQDLFVDSVKELHPNLFK